VAGIVLAALMLEGSMAGAVIVGLLGLLALCRSVCSASYKDVLGKTVEKTARGQTTGAASTVSAAMVLVFAGILMAGPDHKFALIVGALSLAALLWLLAAFFMTRMEEDASEVSNEDSAAAPLRLLVERSDLRRFVAARGLLVGTALAPPYVVLLAADGAVLGQLGALVLASSLGALVSSYVWGWLSDRSSRMVLVWAGIAAALALAACLWIGAGSVWAMAVALFGLMIAYNGVRQGRSTYLVDMAGEEDRAAYTAVSNTAIGLVLIAVGAVAAGLAAWSVPLVIWLFIVMSLAGAAVAWSLKEVETTDA
ncbi:MAG: MFS transporter, partial [Pseudomonadota bacterium]